MIDIFSLKNQHLPAIIEAHMATWAEDDLSAQLGPEFLSNFYRLAVADETTLALGARRGKDADLSCWCLGFRRYSAFNTRLQKRIGVRLYFLAAWQLLSGRLSLTRIKDHFLGVNPARGVRCPENHLGAFGRVGGSFEEVIVLTKLIAHTAAELCADEPACWAVTNDRNKGGKTVMEQAGFQVIDRIDASDRTLVVYEYQSTP